MECLWSRWETWISASINSAVIFCYFSHLNSFMHSFHIFGISKALRLSNFQLKLVYRRFMESFWIRHSRISIFGGWIFLSFKWNLLKHFKIWAVVRWDCWAAISWQTQKGPVPLLYLPISNLWWFPLSVSFCQCLFLWGSSYYSGNGNFLEVLTKGFLIQSWQQC